MKILFAAAEMVPLAKVGGLGDVIGALPSALADRGHDVVVVLPAYGDLGEGFDVLERHSIPVRAGDGKPIETALVKGILRATRDGTAPTEVWLIDQPEFFGRAGVYADPETGEAHPDDGLRWLSFCLAIGPACEAADWFPDVLHANDHHTAPSIPMSQQSERAPATVFSIHNLAYQGHHGLPLLRYAGLRPVSGPGEPFVHWGGANFMKMGIVCADRVTTVSTRYAKEIATDPHFGCGLEEVLAARGSDLTGITNGIDVDEWNPRSDPALVQNFGVGDMSGKRACRDQLLVEMSLRPAGPKTCVAGLVSRFAHQKGIDLFASALDRLFEEDLRVVVLGTGEADIEASLVELRRRHPDRFGLVIGFDSDLARRIEAGADLFLMPSRFEPCGLNQMYSMRYGTVPVVRRTGGLADTVFPFDPSSGHGTGFLFDEETPEALSDAVLEAMATLRNRDAREQIRANGMRSDFSWARSAEAYEAVYLGAIARPRA